MTAVHSLLRPALVRVLVTLGMAVSVGAFADLASAPPRAGVLPVRRARVPVGIHAGGNQMSDAPKPGARVTSGPSGRSRCPTAGCAETAPPREGQRGRLGDAPAALRCAHWGRATRHGTLASLLSDACPGSVVGDTKLEHKSVMSHLHRLNLHTSTQTNNHFWLKAGLRGQAW
jgi:hypothetical protein